jgi:hypothetical protein
MELITILNHCHRHRRFVYEHARFGPDKKSIEVDVTRCRLVAPRAEPSRGQTIIFPSVALSSFRRGASGFPALPHATRGVVVEEVPWGDGKHRLTNWARKFSWKKTAEAKVPRPFLFAGAN